VFNYPTTFLIVNLNAINELTPPDFVFGFDVRHLLGKLLSRKAGKGR
jgi:hypothetical protein